MPRFINPVPQYLNSAGDPIVSGEMYFYEIGSVTPKDTYLDAELTIPATNPVLLNADGRLPDTYLLGSYRTMLNEPSTGQIWERDNVGSEFSEGYGSEWNSTVTYNKPEVVLYDGKYYQSVSFGNIGNTPSSGGANWILVSNGAGGTGASWLDETSSRAINVNYGNPTDNAIMVSIIMSGTVAAQTAEMAVDGLVVDKFSLFGGTGGLRSSLQAIIPSGSTYKLQNVTGTSIESWRELRE